MRKLCAIFAHPDDESFSVGGTLARYADEGVEINLITSSSGEAGEVATPIGEGDLGAWREQELQQAADALGVRNLHLLRFPDGHLPDHAEALNDAIQKQLLEIRPQVVLTEDARGITGHTDHMAVTRAVVRAFDALGAAGPLKLYEHVLPKSFAPEGLYGTPDDYITTTLNVEAWRERQLSGLEAHRSQVGDDLLERFRGFPAPWLDHYVCVRTRVPILIPEEDLFEGI